MEENEGTTGVKSIATLGRFVDLGFASPTIPLWEAKLHSFHAQITN
jgi:hypothetical protein